MNASRYLVSVQPSGRTRAERGNTFCGGYVESTDPATPAAPEAIARRLWDLADGWSRSDHGCTLRVNVIAPGACGSRVWNAREAARAALAECERAVRP